MNIEELRKKIVEIIINAIWKDAEADYDSTDESEARTIADALIVAGIGDVKEAEHRVETLERAFRDFLAEYLTAVNESNSYDCGVPEMFGWYVSVLPNEEKVTNMLNEYLQQVEKELAEERKDD